MGKYQHQRKDLKHFKKLHIGQLWLTSQEAEFKKTLLSEELGFFPQKSELLESWFNWTILEFPNLLTHSQGVEKISKINNWSFTNCKARHKHVITKSLCHQRRPAFTSKGNYSEQFSYDVICYQVQYVSMWCSINNANFKQFVL